MNLGPDEEKTARLRTLADSLAGQDAAEREKTLTELVWTAVQLAGPDADLEKDLSFTLERFIERFPEDGQGDEKGKEKDL